MERRRKQIYVVAALLMSFISRIYSLSVTVNDVECVYEYVLYEGDTVSGNFVVVDHDIFWGSDHPGIDFTVSCLVFHFSFFNSFILILLRGFQSCYVSYQLRYFGNWIHYRYNLVVLVFCYLIIILDLDNRSEKGTKEG